MAKAIYICTRSGNNLCNFEGKFNLLSENLGPKNFKPNSPYIKSEAGISIGIYNPPDVASIRNTSFYLGELTKQQDWEKINSSSPEGTFALFRSNNETVELVSDAVASRTIWYVLTEELFIASTSQRMIIPFLQNYKSNSEVYPWMISTGTLGPGLSWDNRIKFVRGDSKIILDRKAWTISDENQPCSFTQKIINKTEAKQRLSNTIKKSIVNLNLDYKKWSLPLSGGYDSRAILLLLQNQNKINTITWGLESSRVQKGNDAYIADSLSKYYETNHSFYSTDFTDEPLEEIFDRFIKNGEGRIDHISGYMDGFQIWKMLFEKNVKGVIRGDEGFGWTPVSSEKDVKRYIGINTLIDYDNTEKLTSLYPGQKLPDYLSKQENETLEMWRDRLYHQFRIPTVLAALNDLKLTYVEIMSPLLSKSIIYELRNHKDAFRTDKVIFKEIVNQLSPKIEFARYSATMEAKNVLKNKEVVSYIKNYLKTTDQQIFKKEDIEFVLARMNVNNDFHKKTIKQKVKEKLPRNIKNLLSNNIIKSNIDYNVVAFRLFIIFKMQNLLLNDALLFKKDHLV
jgi:Asparagine synthase